MRAALAHRSSVLNSIANPPGSIWTLSPIQEASGIAAEPAGMRVTSTIEPQNNWAQIYYENNQDTSGTSVYLQFYFQWENPFAYAVVLAASTNLGANGEIDTGANPGLFSGGHVSVQLWATLDVYVGGVDINYPMGQDAMGPPVTVYGGDLFNGTAHLGGTPIYQYDYLSCQPIPVDAGQAAIFVVSMRADMKINNGVAYLDFSDNYGFVMCPGITLQLLTRPPIEGGSA
jgi:hypothetical protein